MPPRAIASVKLSFGLVTVPVNIYTSGESSSKISFNWLHKKCKNRLKQQYHCPEDNVVVEKDDRVKGYEFQKGEYVLFTPEEIKLLEAKGNQTIEIAEFVPESEVDRVFLSKIYYLGPDKGGDKAYHLLASALKKTKRAALARYAARGKMYLVMIRPMGDGLVMDQLFYEHEIKPFAEVPLGKAEVKKAELDLAVKIVDQGAVEEFHPENYQDEVRERVLKNIERKVEGKEIARIEERPEKKVVDLMEALKQSLANPARKKLPKDASSRKKAKSKRKKTA